MKAKDAVSEAYRLGFWDCREHVIDAMTQILDDTLSLDNKESRAKWVGYYNALNADADAQLYKKIQEAEKECKPAEVVELVKPDRPKS